MASAHGHLNNEVMNNNRPPAPKFRKWLMRNNKSSLSGLTGEIRAAVLCLIRGSGRCSAAYSRAIEGSGSEQAI